MTKDGRQRTEDREQRTEDRGRKTRDEKNIESFPSITLRVNSLRSGLRLIQVRLADDG